MKQSARAVIVKDGSLLLMKRFKMGEQYYTLPGGGIEEGETAAETAIREVKEESGLVIESPKLVYIEHAGNPFGVQFIYVCQYVSGDPKLPADSEEAFWSTEGKNTYEPMWFPYDQLESIPFVSPLLKELLLRARKDGFPDAPYEFSSVHAARLS